jgi:aromatic-L-amino-acid/L-tryptophan decarboxylase
MKQERSLSLPATETLDPADWDQLKSVGRKMVTDMINFLQTVSTRPVWKKPTEEVKHFFTESLPTDEQDITKVYDEFKKNILPYHLGNIHPRFWSWVVGTGSAQGMLAEMLAAGINSNVGIGDQAAMYADAQVVNWCKEMMGFPEESSGTIVSGASAANLNALVVARNSVNKYIRSRGVQIYSSKLVMYASTETHSSIQKAAEIIGIGSDGLRKVRVDEDFRMDTNHLEELIARDKAAGNIPFCVVANVGTVNTAAIDPLDEIFLICMKYNLWFHVDGAFGALAKLTPEYHEELQIMEMADSIAFDLHKWMYMPYEAGVVLIRNAEKHRESFALQPDYIMKHERGIGGGPELPSNFGFDLSRGFKSLKIWMGLKEHGINKYVRLIQQNIHQARYLQNLIRKEKTLQLLAPVSLNIVCFRYNPGMLTKWELNKLNKEILMRLHEGGIAAPSYTMLHDEYCFRVAIVNHRSKSKDFDLLVKEILRIGNTVIEEESKEINSMDCKVA